MMNRKLYLLVFLIMGLMSCKKEPGAGGLATIEGNVYSNLFDPSGNFMEKVAAGDKNVYLVYGDNENYDERVDTDADGKYQFKGLQKGNYVVYTFADCISCPSGLDEVEIEVEITDKKGTATANDLIAAKDLDYNDGSAVIKGRVYERQIQNSTGIQTSAAYEDNIRVYLFFGSDIVAFDDVRTSGGGNFEFRELLKENYTVSVSSDINLTSKTTVQVITEVTANGQTVDIGDINIDEHY